VLVRWQEPALASLFVSNLPLMAPPRCCKARSNGLSGALLFGVLIAATDPVSVIATFKEMRVGILNPPQTSAARAGLIWRILGTTALEFLIQSASINFAARKHL
jgi:hypothetical protein